MTQRYLTIPFIALALYVSLFILPALGSPLFGFNVLPITILLILLFGDTAVATIGALVGGMIMDIASPFPFGMYTVSLCGTVMVTHWIFRIRFTNRSLIAYLSLVVFGCITTSLFSTLYSMILPLIGVQAIANPMSLPLFIGIGIDVLRGTLIALIVYLIVRATGHSYATLVSQEF